MCASACAFVCVCVFVCVDYSRFFHSPRRASVRNGVRVVFGAPSLALQMFVSYSSCRGEEGPPASLPCQPTTGVRADPKGLAHLPLPPSLSVGLLLSLNLAHSHNPIARPFVSRCYDRMRAPPKPISCPACYRRRTSTSALLSPVTATAAQQPHPHPHPFSCNACRRP